jgi:hypothetical protein
MTVPVSEVVMGIIRISQDLMKEFRKHMILVEDKDRLDEELLYFQFLAVDFTLHMAKMEQSQKQLIRKRYSECWYEMAEKQIDKEIVDEQLNKRLEAYLPIVTQTDGNYHLQLGLIFSKFCCEEEDLEIAMQAGTLFHNTLDAIVKYVVPLSRE